MELYSTELTAKYSNLDYIAQTNTASRQHTVGNYD